MDRIQEQQLLQKARSGDADAFEEIVRNNEKIVYSLALRHLGNPQDAEDAAQEVFLKAFTGLKSFRGDAKLSVWLYRITCNVCTDILRRRKDTVSLSAEKDDGAPLLELSDDRFDPVEITERSELREEVGKALAQLPEEARRILVLREIAGLSYEEIAQTTDLDMGTVKSRIFRARKKLCRLLQGNISDVTASKSAEGGVQA